MKTNHTVSGMILLFLGIYFLLQQFNISIPFAEVLFRWPSILFGLGLVFMWQGFSNKDDSSMFSGSVLTGLGILFHGSTTFEVWSLTWPYFTLVIGLAFLMKYNVRKKDGLSTGIILLLITAVGVFASQVLPLFQDTVGSFTSFWPLAFVAVGIYYLFFRKSR
ncbi:LiaI-LiaF-like domain-containing protein [Alkalicoccus halolimnae]|uniref:DUF5668 domain-containing protein n=1 Tax=Alkalicoccus halolimnae TaxID=1667239 RepID=A0A5C7FEU0_9BACI|nr:DUF5668 domain-containing protein [Alkalicoccus halolimnae]TXF85807.1 hypothetical protein FTX54_06940 [Alkalicoccus halolimnae]